MKQHYTPNIMKKFRTLFLSVLAVALCAGFTSCDDDDDLPNVNMGITIEGGVFGPDGDIYVVQGDQLNILSVNVQNNVPNQGAALANVSYYLNSIYLGTTNLPPFSCNEITGENTPVGEYDLDITCNVLAVDKELAIASLDYDIEVVPDASYIPVGSTNNNVQSSSLKK